MKIVKVQKTKLGRFSIFDETGFLASIHPDVFYLYHIKEGQELSEELLEEILELSDYTTAKQKALAMLSRRPMTGHQLKEKLEAIVTAEIAQQTVERMQELGLICDADYAGRLSRDMLYIKHYGPNRIQNELQKRGIEKEIVLEAIDALEIDESAEILQILQKKKYDLSNPKEKNKAVNALLRYGYHIDSIKSAIYHILNDEEDFDEN